MCAKKSCEFSENDEVFCLEVSTFGSDAQRIEGEGNMEPRTDKLNYIHSGASIIFSFMQ